MSFTLIDSMLAEQADLSAVSRFANDHAAGRLDARKKAYESLIPLSRPQSGEQYAFAVDLDRCTGCKACVAACHSLNGLEENETWREVGLLLDEPQRPRQQTVTSACHHCAEPGCLEGCPVLAYEKDVETGIVRHLDDQCIGCQYCVLKCPYEVPKYSKKLGIVRKCDMCHSRLAVGEAPACVQACPTQAISIRIVTQKQIEFQATNDLFLADSPNPNITKPSTVYHSARPLSERAQAADHRLASVQHTHWPLVWMLVLTQAGLGLFVGALFGAPFAVCVILGAILVQAGLGASVLHLGQPLKAWRAFLGWRRSWLSREVMVLGGFGAVAMLAIPFAFWPPLAAWQIPLSFGVVFTGFLGVLCSAWVYHDTKRQVWRGPLSFVRFFWTVALFAAWSLGSREMFAVLLVGKLAAECLLAVRGLTARVSLDDLDRSAQLLRGPLRFWFFARLMLGGMAFAALYVNQPWPALVLLLGGEILERALFFKAGVSKKMPGQNL